MADAKPGSVRVRIISSPKNEAADHHFTQINRMKRITQVSLGTYRDLFNLFLKANGSAQADVIITENSDEAFSNRDLELRYKFDVAVEELQRLQVWSVVSGKSHERFYLTSFGCQFMTVCNPPQSIKTQE
jgi:hypothetical protein